VPCSVQGRDEPATEGPLVGDDVGLGGGTHEITGVVGHKGIIVGLHSIEPIGIHESSPNQFGNRRGDADGRGAGGEEPRASTATLQS
jgi:hypothetical protein